MLASYYCKKKKQEKKIKKNLLCIPLLGSF